MLIVVESGSTKADWMVVDGHNETTHSTKGFNPYFHTKEDILIELNYHLELDLIKEKVSELFFYGAGCSSSELNEIIKSALEVFFENATVHVNHDLSACAYACYANKPEIACIIGTGSNSCYYDGKLLYEEVPALSYILGDEGSGSCFGKIILSDFLYKKLPTKIAQDLKNRGVTKDVIFENVYRKPDANVYIASFTSILIHHKDLEYSQQIIREAFQRFIDIHVKCYPNYEQCEVNFVGSVASLLQTELKAVCAENNIQVGRIIRRPLEKLVRYHQNLQNSAQSNLAKHQQPNAN